MVWPGKIKYYLRDEVVIHNTMYDIWVIVQCRVYDLTRLIEDRMDSMNDNLRMLIAYAGKDLTTFFDRYGNPQMRFSADGQFEPLLNAAFEIATSDFNKTKDCYWWEDPIYKIGKLTSQERPLRIINTLIYTTIEMTVCEEDTIYDIQAKYRAKYNHHAGSYTWRKTTISEKKSGRLSLERTLTQNGISKEKYNPPPVLWLYFNDDFTIA